MSHNINSQLNYREKSFISRYFFNFLSLDIIETNNKIFENVEYIMYWLCRITFHKYQLGEKPSIHKITEQKITMINTIDYYMIYYIFVTFLYFQET